MLMFYMLILKTTWGRVAHLISRIACPLIEMGLLQQTLKSYISMEEMGKPKLFGPRAYGSQLIYKNDSP